MSARNNSRTRGAPDAYGAVDLCRWPDKRNAMNQSENNPNSNQLNAGVTEALVLDAVRRSGYPLQTFIADLLRENQLGVQEEWSFIDKDLGDLRALDIHASKRLYDLKGNHRVRPHLNLLIECKQSDLPYMFFKAIGNTWLPDFPRIGGLSKDEIVISTDDDRSTWSHSIINALQLDKHDFHTQSVFCHTFSKCVRKGKELELSGSDAYNGLVLPLTKAVQHLVHAERPGETAAYFDAHLILGVGVVDAPMVTVELENGSPILSMTPWVRVLRHEYVDSDGWWERNKMRAIDVVHKDYFSQYLLGGLIPFAEEFGQLVLKHSKEVSTGEAFVSGMGRNSRSDLEPRMKPAASNPPKGQGA